MKIKDERKRGKKHKHKKKQRGDASYIQCPVPIITNLSHGKCCCWAYYVRLHIDDTNKQKIAKQ